MYQKANCGYVAEVSLYFLYICKLYRCIVSQKREYTGCTELTAWLYSYNIFFNIGVYNITHLFRAMPKLYPCNTLW